MTSYERVKAALEHREADRIPFDLGGTVLTGMNVHCYRRLRQHLGMSCDNIEIFDPTQQLARVDEDMVERLKIDVRCVDPLPPLAPHYGSAPVLDGNCYVMKDEWNISWKMPAQGGHYFDMVGHPLEDAEDISDLEDFQWPDPVDPGRFVTMKERADHYVYDKKQTYVLGRFCAGIWELGLWTNGFEKFFCDMLINESYAHYVLDKVTELKMQYWEKALETVGENVLVVSEADDLATQISTLVSPELYKKMVSPYHKKLYDFIRSKAKNPVHIFYHSCGAVKNMIPCLIEEGVDILNPVQVSAAGMDTKELKREFGKDITFWGGGVDTQRILPYGKPQEVRDEVKRRIEDLAPGGGFVFAAVHNVQNDVPAENFMAMWETLQEYGLYR